MAYRDIVFVEFNDIELHLLVDEKFQWLITFKELASAFDVGLDILMKTKDEHEADLSEGKHFIFDSIENEYHSDNTKRLLWTKKGVMRLAFWINVPSVIDAIDFFEELQFNRVKREPHEKIYNEVELALLDSVESLRSKEGLHLDELNELIDSVDKFTQKKRSLDQKEPKSGSNPLMDGIKKLLSLEPEQMNKMVEGFVKQAMEQRAAQKQSNT